MSDRLSFFSELKRCNVHKVPVANIRVFFFDPLGGDPRFKTLVQKVVGPK
jgi:hypothetical protein